MRRTQVVVVCGLVAIERGLGSADAERPAVAGRAASFGGDGSAAAHAGDPRGEYGPRRQVSRRRGHREGPGRRLCGVVRRLGGRDLQPLGSGRRQADHVQVGRRAAGQRREAVAPAHPRGRRHGRLHGRRQSLPPAEEREGRLRLRPALLPLLHEVQPGACPHSPLRQRADRLPPAHALAAGRSRRAAARAMPAGPPRSSRATSPPGTSTATGKGWAGARLGVRPGGTPSRSACRLAPWPRSSGSAWKSWSR